MSSELQTIPPAQLTQVHAQPTFADLERAAKYVSESGVFGRLSVAQAMTLFLVAQSEGINPMRALKIYDIIQGKAALKPAIMLARYQSDGGRIKYIERSNTRCVIEFVHPQADTLQVTWTIEDAKRIGLAGKDNWRNYPAPMLQWRCIAEGIRATAPGVLDGMYSSDEVRDFAEPDDYASGPTVITEGSGKPRHTFTAKQQAQIDADKAELERRALADATAKPLTDMLAAQGITVVDCTPNARHIAEVLPDLGPPPIEPAPVMPPIPAPTPLSDGASGWQIIGGWPLEAKRGGKVFNAIRYQLSNSVGQECEAIYWSMDMARKRSGLDDPSRYRGMITCKLTAAAGGKWDMTDLAYPELTGAALPMDDDGNAPDGAMPPLSKGD